MNAPVAFFFFNRAHTVLRVFERIRQARPGRLVLVSDGPRPGVSGEDRLIKALRRMIESRIDWPAQVETEYAGTNMGCARRLASGISTVLARHGEAILVEDDCLPAPTFFDYASSMLDRYRDEERVLSVSGTYFLRKSRRTVDVGFTHFPQIWGWATWARAWEGYDQTLRQWDDGFLHAIATRGTIPAFELRAWKDIFAKIVANPDHTWDMQFWLLCLKKGGLTAFPYRNQITNIGAGVDATHMKRWWFADVPQYAFPHPVRAPDKLQTDAAYERYLQNEFYAYRVTLRNVHHYVPILARAALRRLRGRF